MLESYKPNQVNQRLDPFVPVRLFITDRDAIKGFTYLLLTIQDAVFELHKT